MISFVCIPSTIDNDGEWYGDCIRSCIVEIDYIDQVQKSLRLCIIHPQKPEIMGGGERRKSVKFPRWKGKRVCLANQPQLGVSGAF